MIWISVKNKEIILPSMSKVILVTDGENYQLITVEKFLETVDKPYNTWTHWMKIPKIEEISEGELNNLAIQYTGSSYSWPDYDERGNHREDLREAYKVGYRKALENI